MIERLYIAEKPDIARAIADYLGGTWNKNKSFYKQGNTVITWCYGHILELFEPEDYKEEWRSWYQFPIIPEIWKNKPKADAVNQFKSIASLLKDTKEVIHAGDPDEEGQLLVDEVLKQCNFKGNVLRILINAKDDKSMKRAFDGINANNKYKGMYLSAVARQRIDWLIGMNLTRLFTIYGRKIGMSTTLPVGRVKTPVLALVVNREKEINDFKETVYYELKIKAGQGNSYITGIHETDNYLTNKNQAFELKRQIENEENIEISLYEKKDKTENPPLPYSLDSLQADAGKKYGWSPADVLKLTQSLYEKKFVSYPRSDCNYIPTGQFEDVLEIMKNLQGYFANQPFILKALLGMNATIKSRCFDDKKVTAHHAIIPTGVAPKGLSDDESKLYNLICLRYAIQFYPKHEYTEHTYKFTTCGESFKGKTKFIKINGWKDAIEKEINNEEEIIEENLSFNVGDKLIISEVSMQEKITKPPKRFTESSLLSAMVNIHRYVSNPNPEIKEKLKELKGIGTPATRSKIINDLIYGKNPLLKIEKKKVVPTNEGKILIGILPEDITKPDKTAEMKILLDKVNKETSIPLFNKIIDDTCKYLEETKNSLNTKKIIPPEELGLKTFTCPECKKGYLSRKKWQKNYFWGCSRYQKGCKSTFDDKNGEPQIINCPECKKGFMKKRKGKNGYFWGCSRYQEGCKCTGNDKKGKPDFSKVKK